MGKRLMSAMRATLLLRALLSVVLVNAAPVAPILHTDDGPIQGKRNTKLAVSEFHGVPFASPPIGELRWRAPERPNRWNKTLQTTKPVSVCPQLDLNKGVHFGAEDCLYLSLYIPDGCTKENSCPVMQWIHGGAWIFGSNYQLGSYDGSILAAQHQVIVVGGNYRLDSLGWLALEELAEESQDGSYGNYGLQDQQAVLRWIRRNANTLGGDANRVTMWGQSAGGFSVCQHLVSPGSGGLFSRAIIESGGCDGPWLIQDGKSAQMWSNAVAERTMGCPSRLSGKERMACLRRLPMSAVVTQFNESWLCLNHDAWNSTDPWCDLTPSTHRPPLGVLGGWSSVVDGQVLPDVPINLITKGAINKGPQGEALSVIIGTNTDDYALFAVLLTLILPGIKLPFTTQLFSQNTTPQSTSMTPLESQLTAQTCCSVVAPELLQELCPLPVYQHTCISLISGQTRMCLTVKNAS